jgi:hypothetical protein
VNEITEYEPFRALLDGLCATWDRPPAKDEMVLAYWNALKDARYGEVKSNVERLIRTATRESKWPRPGDLRNEPPTNVLPSREAEFKACEQACARNWDDRLRVDPELTRMELAIAKTDRVLASEHQGSPIYATALDENRMYRNQLRELQVARLKQQALL